VDRLHLRLPVATAAAGRRVVERAVALASARLSAAGLSPGHFSELRLVVRPNSSNEEGLAQAICDALVRAVTGAGDDHFDASTEETSHA
jgi:hypothetical protein